MRIGVRGIDQVYPGIQRRVDDVDALFLVGIAIGAEHHGSESVCADADAGSSERAVFHVVSSLGCGWRPCKSSLQKAIFSRYEATRSRRAAATLRRHPFAFALSEVAISRRFRWPLALPNSHFARCLLLQSALTVLRRCTLQPQVYSGRTGESAPRWPRCRVRPPRTTSPIRAPVSRRQPRQTRRSIEWHAGHGNG